MIGVCVCVCVCVLCVEVHGLEAVAHVGEGVGDVGVLELEDCVEALVEVLAHKLCNHRRHAQVVDALQKPVPVPRPRVPEAGGKG